jgi:cell division control protein 6
VLQDLKAVFRRSTAPKELLGRDNEKKTIRLFLSTHLQAKKGGSLYISGCPGAGKTAVVDEILAEVTHGKVAVVFVFVFCWSQN